MKKHLKPLVENSIGRSKMADGVVKVAPVSANTGFSCCYLNGPVWLDR